MSAVHTSVPRGWSAGPLLPLVRHKSGDSKIIKGKQAAERHPDLFQGFSASGPDIWVDAAQYSGPGVVVSAVGARCGKTFYADGEWTAIANTHALVPGPEVNPRFLWHLTNREDWWIKSGTAQPFVKVKATLEREQLLPPLAEQERIVEILEEHLSRLDAALDSIRAVRDKADQLQRSVLHAAFSGVLPGCEFGEAPSMPLDALNDPSRPICYGILMPGPDVEGGVPYVKVKNIRNGRVDVGALQRTTPEIENKFARSRLRSGDLLVTIRGTYGRTAPVPPELNGGNVTQDTARVAPVGVSAQFLLRFLDSPGAQQYFNAVARGVAVKGVNIRDLRQLPVPVPSADDQAKVARALDDQLSLIDAATVRYKAAEDRAESLRRSLLHAAFTGRLTEDWREQHRG